jgi:hypothetical protein
LETEDIGNRDCREGLAHPGRLGEGHGCRSWWWKHPIAIGFLGVDRIMMKLHEIPDFIRQFSIVFWRHRWFYENLRIRCTKKAAMRIRIILIKQSDIIYQGRMT